MTREKLINMVWPISHDRGDFLAVGIALEDVKQLYQSAENKSELETGEAVRIPTSIDEARLMAVLGTNYLIEHAPHLISKDFLKP